MSGKHQDLQIIMWSEIKQMCVIFTNFELWVAVGELHVSSAL